MNKFNENLAKFKPPMPEVDCLTINTLIEDLFQFLDKGYSEDTYADVLECTVSSDIFADYGYLTRARIVDANQETARLVRLLQGYQTLIDYYRQNKISK